MAAELSISAQTIGTGRIDDAATPQTMSRRAAASVVWLLPALTCVYAAAMYAPRFGIRSPSLVDDWFSLTYAPTAVHELVRGHYDAEMVDYGGRYRPTYALMSYLQWALGSRTSTLVPTVVGLVRVYFFLAAAAALTIAVMRRTASRGWLITSAAAVPVLVIGSQDISYNFVRFGAAEPTSFAATVLGATCVTAAVGQLLRASGRDTKIRSGALAAGGYLIYLFGVYMWEASVVMVIVIPALYWMTAEHDDLRTHPSFRKAMLTGGALLVLPIGHILWKITPQLGHGDHRGSSVSGALTQLAQPADSMLVGIFTDTGTAIWALLLPLTLAVSLRRLRAGDRQAGLATAIILAGLAAAYVSTVGTDGAAFGRYYVPLVTAVAVVFVWLLATLDAAPRAIILASTAVVIIAGRGDLMTETWLGNDRAGDAAVQLASQAYATGCPVYLVGFRGERGMGLSRVLDPAAKEVGATCRGGDTKAYEVLWAAALPVKASGCSTGWREVKHQGRVGLDVCARFAPGKQVPTQDISAVDPPLVVRLRAPTRWVDASTLNHLAYVRGD